MGRKSDIAKAVGFKKKLSRIMPLERMILFGSRASGKPHRWSDFDFIIVSDGFKGIDTLKRSPKFYKIWDLDYPVDFLCYTPNEFKKLKNELSILRDAVNKGVAV